MLDLSHHIRLTSTRSASGRAWAVFVDDAIHQVFTGDDVREQAVECAFRRAEELRTNGNVLMILEPAGGGQTVACVVRRASPAMVAVRRPHDPTASPGPGSIYRGATAAPLGGAHREQVDSRGHVIGRAALSPGLRRALALTALGGGLFIATATMVGELGADRRALRAMPAADRRALFDTTRLNVEALCAETSRRGELGDRCAAAATFLGTFPECDTACQTRAHNVQHRATR